MSPRYLTTDDLLLLAVEVRAGPVRDLGLLGAAAGRPQTSALGDDAYVSLPEKAASVLHSLARHHPLVDGNTRLAWLATVVFLDINGWQVTLTGDEAFELVMDVATSDLDVSEIAVRLGAKPPPG